MKNNQGEVKKFTILLEYSRSCIVITLTITRTAFNQKKITVACIQRRDADMENNRHSVGRCVRSTPKMSVLVALSKIERHCLGKQKDLIG